MPDTTPAKIREAATEYLLLAQVLTKAEAVQWQPSPVPKPREDVIRSAGGHGDPTGDAALDPRRLKLRAAVIAAERETDDLLTRLRCARANVEQELTRYLGDA